VSDAGEPAKRVGYEQIPNEKADFDNASKFMEGKVTGCGACGFTGGECEYGGTGWLEVGDPSRARPTPVQHRFWGKVDTAGDCWNWMADRHKRGYGLFHVGRFGGKRRVSVAHRVAWEMLVGPIPSGLVLDHLCRNTSCVNPDHLEPVSQRENVLRGAVTAPRTRRTTCAKGLHSMSDALVDPRTGWRECRPCALASARERYRRKVAA
jgi:hypothetical protein